MKTILSTKKLNPSQRSLILTAGLGVVEYNALAVEFLDFEAPARIENAIFTSQNAVHAVEQKNIAIENAFCVGEKTEQLLAKNAIKVLKKSKNASKLANFIQKHYKIGVFYFFSGSRRRDEIPTQLMASSLTFLEVKTYKTILHKKKFHQTWDGILFFSPSGVKSYTAKNGIGTIPVFCIGETTASEAKKHTQNVTVAHSTTIESVIAKAVNTLRAHDKE